MARRGSARQRAAGQGTAREPGGAIRRALSFDSTPPIAAATLPPKRLGGFVDDQFNEDLLAELAAINMVLAQLISFAAAIAEEQGIPRKAYLDRLLESGIEEIGRTDFYSIPVDRRSAVTEKARARFSQIIAAQHRGPA